MRRALPYLAVLAVAGAGVGYSMAGNVSLGSHVGDYRSGNGGGIDATGTEVTGTGSCSAADSVVYDNNGGNGCPPTSDAVPATVAYSGQDALRTAATNVTGGTTYHCGGIGRRIATIVDFSLIDDGVDTVVVNVDSTTTTLTAETDSGDVGALEFLVATSNAVTATNLAAKIAAVTGVLTADTSSNVVRVAFQPWVCVAYVGTTCAAGECTTTNSANGGIILGQLVITPSSSNGSSSNTTSISALESGTLSFSQSTTFSNSMTLGGTASTISLTGTGVHVATSGTDPVPSACGTTPSVLGSDVAGKVTIGTGVTTSCTVTFQSAYANAPACVVTGDNPALSYAATTTTTTLVITSAVDMASDVISYICMQVS